MIWKFEKYSSLFSLTIFVSKSHKKINATTNCFVRISNDRMYNIYLNIQCNNFARTSKTIKIAKSRCFENQSYNLTLSKKLKFIFVFVCVNVMLLNFIHIKNQTFMFKTFFNQNCYHFFRSHEWFVCEIFLFCNRLNDKYEWSTTIARCFKSLIRHCFVNDMNDFSLFYNVCFSIILWNICDIKTTQIKIVKLHRVKSRDFSNRVQLFRS